MKNKKLYIAILLLVLFIANTIIMQLDYYTAVDEAVHMFFMSFYSSGADKFMRFITFFGSTTWIIIIAVILFFFFLWRRRKDKAFSLASLIIISTVINNVIKLILRRSRPEYITVVEHSFSYPSGHTMASTTLYGFLIYLLIKSSISKGNKIMFGALLGILILLVGSSRIYLGAHFFSDVFGGILLSTFILLVFDIINDKKKILK